MIKYFLPLFALGWAQALFAATKEQIFSRENPNFACRTALIALGRDGSLHAYADHTGKHPWTLRMDREGAVRTSRSLPERLAVTSLAVNRDGVIALACAHFAHKVLVLDQRLSPVGECRDFLVGDAHGWNAPNHIEAGASGDFYAMDQHRNRIVRIAPTGKSVMAYALPQQPSGGTVLDFRVWEKGQSFFLLTKNNELSRVGFDGKLLWKRSAPVAANWDAFVGCFDVDEDGVMHWLNSMDSVVRRVTADNQPLPEIKLALDRRVPGDGWFIQLRVASGELYLR